MHPWLKEENIILFINVLAPLQAQLFGFVERPHDQILLRHVYVITYAQSVCVATPRPLPPQLFGWLSEKDTFLSVRPEPMVDHIAPPLPPWPVPPLLPVSTEFVIQTVPPPIQIAPPDLKFVQQTETQGRDIDIALWCGCMTLCTYTFVLAGSFRVGSQRRLSSCKASYDVCI